MPKGLRPITMLNVFEGAKLTVAGGVSTSVGFDLREIAQNGMFSLEYLITGDGTATISYTVCSTKGGTYFTPAGGGSIASGLTKTSGDGAGHGGLSFEPEMYPFIKIVVTETGASQSVTALLNLNVQ